MKNRFFIFFFILLAWLAGISSVLQAQTKPVDAEKPLTRILFVFDASQSMLGQWQSDQKYIRARKLMAHVLDTLKSIENLEVALRVYGHQHKYPPQVCNDTRLEVPFGKNNFDKINHRLNSITPKGTSPISFALSQAVNDFPACDHCRNIIVLITDGIEECGGDPCEVSKMLQKNGVVLKPFIIGIGQNFAEAFECVGSYFDASSEEQFSNALNIVISRALDPTSVQINLLDEFNQPTETNVNMTFYDDVSGKVKYNFIHTMNSRGIPDTLFIDPLIQYRMVVHTLPPVEVENIKLVPGKHNLIPAYAPQGKLHILFDSPSAVSKHPMPCLVRKKGRQEIVYVQDIGMSEKYLNGNYTIEVLSLPRVLIDSVSIRQSNTTTVSIPSPGIAVIKKNTRGYGGIYVERNGGLEMVYNFREDNPKQESLIMMPGDYRAVFRSKYLNRSMFTIEKKFQVKSGITTNVRLFQ